MKILGSRVDGLTLAYRVTLDPAFVDALRERSRVANKHGRAGFEWRNRVPVGVAANGPRDPKGGVARLGGLRARWAEEQTGPVEYVRGMWGELKFSDRASCWQLTNQPYFRMLVRLHAPGAVERMNDRTGAHESEGGWTIEVVFYAQWLAEVGLDVAIREGEALAALCGEVHERRTRRIDLCADIEGWRIREGDVRRLVKRPRARWQKEYGDVGVGPGGVATPLPREEEKESSRKVTKTERHEMVRAQDFGRGALDKRQITGVSVGRGGAMMSRIYDKRAELERDEERRRNEEARWLKKGWDGVTRVTRVEFQVRGVVVKELGLLDPGEAKDVIFEKVIDDRGRERERVVGHRPMVTEDGEVLGLADRLDWLWRTCLDWVRIVKLERRDDGRLKPVGRLPEDPRWAFLRTVSFTDARAPSAIKRFRVRTAASAAMGLGVALAQAGRDGELVIVPENSGAYDEATAREELVARLTKLKIDEAMKIVEWLLTDKGGAIGALVHLAVRSNAACLRFRERRATHAGLATGPPDGGGPRSSAFARRGGPDSTGDGEAGRAVA